MSRILVKVNGKDAMIVGYCPTDNGIHAIVIGEGALDAVPLQAIQLQRLPKRLRKANRKTRRAARVMTPSDIDMGQRVN